MGLRLILAAILALSPLSNLAKADEAVRAGSGAPSSGSSGGARPTGVDQKTCARVLETWVQDDYQNRFFGLLKSRAISCELFTERAKTLNSADSLRSYYEDRFKESMDDNTRNYLKGCSVDNHPKGKEIVGRYFYAMDRFESASPQIIEQVAAIDNILPGRQTLQDFECGNRFGVQKICDGLKNACQGVSNTEADFDKLVGKVKAALEEIHDIERTKVACARNRMLLFSDESEYKSDLSRYFGNDRSNVLKIFADLPYVQKRFPTFSGNVEDMKRYPQNQTISQTTYQNFSKICKDSGMQARIEQLKARYPFMQGDIFKSGTRSNMGPSFVTKAQYRDAIKKQLEENRKQLTQAHANIQTAANCMTAPPPATIQKMNMRFGTYYDAPNPDNEACHPDKLTTTVANTPQLNEFYKGDKVFNESMSMQVSQACKIEGSDDRNKTAKILNDSAAAALLTVGTAGIGIGVSGLTGFGKTLIAARTPGTFTRFAPGFTLGTDLGFAALDTQAAIEACSTDLVKMQNNFADFEKTKANQCPTAKNQVSSALESADECIYGKTVALAGYGTAGIAGLTALRGLRMADDAAAKAAAAGRAPGSTPAPTVQAASPNPTPVAATPTAPVTSKPATTPKPPPATKPASAATKPATSSPPVRDAMPSIQQQRNAFEPDSFLNPSLANATVVKRIDSIDGRVVDGFTGAQNNGVEILDVDGKNVFAKVTGLRDGGVDSQFENELFFAKKIEELGVGPRLRGSFKGADGNYRIATDLIEGTDLKVTGRFGRVDGDLSKVSDKTIQQIEQIQKKLVDNGINPLDLQFRIDKNGRPHVVDTALFKALRPDEKAEVVAKLSGDLESIRRAKRTSEASQRNFDEQLLEAKPAAATSPSKPTAAASSTGGNSVDAASPPAPSVAARSPIERQEIPVAEVRSTAAGAKPSTGATRLPDMTGKTRLEAVQELEGKGFRYKSTTAGGYRQFVHSDGSIVWIRPNGEVTRSGPEILSKEGKKYRPRFDQNGRKINADEHNTGEFLSSESIHPRSRLTEAELKFNAAKPISSQKATELETILKRPTGSLSRDEDFITEWKRIEKEFPTPATLKPASQRTRAEQEMLVKKREALRKLGLSDKEIQDGMDNGYFGMAVPDEGFRLGHAGQYQVIRVNDPDLNRAFTNGKIAPQQRYISFQDDNIGRRVAGVVESIDNKGNVTIFDGVERRVLTSEQKLSARQSATSASQFKNYTSFEEVFPKDSPSIGIEWSDQDYVQNKIRMRDGRNAVVEQGPSARMYAVEKGLIQENVQVNNLERGQSYTYVILDDGTVAYGNVKNSFEYGVKHIQLANGRPVVAAGELRVNLDGSVVFNLESGTFTKPLIQQKGVSPEDLKQKVQQVIGGRADTEMKYTNEILVSKEDPTRSQMMDLCGRSGISAPTCDDLQAPVVSSQVVARPQYPAGAARNPGAMASRDAPTPVNNQSAAVPVRPATPAEMNQADQYFARDARARRGQVLEPVPTNAELARNAGYESVDRVRALEKEMGRPLIVKDKSGRRRGLSEVASGLDDIHERFPIPVSRKPFSERTRQEREMIIGKMRELKKFGMSDDDILICMRNGFCGDPPSTAGARGAAARSAAGTNPSPMTATRILDSASPPPLATPTRAQADVTLRRAQEEIKTFNFKSTEEAQLSEVGPAFSGAKGSSENAQNGFAGARNFGVEIVPGPERPLFAKITQVSPDTDPTKMRVFQNEVFFTKYMSDIGKGPEFHGIFVRRAKPGQKPVLGDGNYRIMTDAVPGENFQLSASTPADVRKFSFSDIDQFEREAKSLVTDFGVNPGDYQARVARTADGKPRVYVVDTATYSFHRGKPQRALDYLQISFQEYKAQKIVTELGATMGAQFTNGFDLRRQLEKLPAADFDRAYARFRDSSPTERARLATLPLSEWMKP